MSPAALHELEVVTHVSSSTAVAASANDSSSRAVKNGEGAADATTSVPNASIAPSEAASTAVAAPASGSNSCQTLADASEAGTASPPAADALKSESDAVVTHAPSSSPPSVTQQTAAPHPADDPPTASTSSPSLKQGLATHPTPGSCARLGEADSAFSGGDAAAEQAPAHSLDGSQAQSHSPIASALSQSFSSRGDAQQPEDSSSCCDGNDHPCSRGEEEQPREQDPSELPQEEEDEQMSEHSAPLPLPLPQPLPAGSAQADLGAHQAQEDMQTEATAGCSDASCNAADVPEPKKKPGFLAKTVFCTIFSPILVPVLAVGACLQLYEALSVQRTMWNYTMAGSQTGCNSGTAA